jgi:hypothetical protein
MPSRPPEPERASSDIEFDEETYVAQILLQSSIVRRPAHPPLVNTDVEIEGEPVIIPTLLETPATPIHESTTSLSACAARLLFGPEIYQRYLLWQNTIGDPHEARNYKSLDEWKMIREQLYHRPIGEIPSPYLYLVSLVITYKDTIFRPLEDHDTHPSVPGLKLGRATLCRHALHPVDSRLNVKVCYVCLVERSTYLLTGIQRILSIISEELPCRSLLGAKNYWGETVYNIAINLWRIEKTNWANLVNECQILVEAEHRWEIELAAGDPKRMRLLETTYPCSQALHAAAKCPALNRRWGDAYNNGKIAALNLLDRDGRSKIRNEKDQLETLKRGKFPSDLEHYSSILGDNFPHNIQMYPRVLQEAEAVWARSRVKTERRIAELQQLRDDPNAEPPQFTAGLHGYAERPLWIASSSCINPIPPSTTMSATVRKKRPTFSDEIEQIPRHGEHASGQPCEIWKGSGQARLPLRSALKADTKNPIKTHPDALSICIFEQQIEMAMYYEEVMAVERETRISSPNSLGQNAVADKRVEHVWGSEEDTLRLNRRLLEGRGDNSRLLMIHDHSASLFRRK